MTAPRTETVGYLTGNREVETTELVDNRGHLQVTAPGNAWGAPKRDGWVHFFTARHGDYTRFIYRRHPA